jgi:hypothetical protein
MNQMGAEMQQATKISVFGVVAIVLLLEFAGVGASLASAPHTELADACYGYAYCQ